jgi:protein-S-isoprenylcysteine O-methyltransferase Ste14
MTGALVLASAFALGWVPLYLYRAEAMWEALAYYSATERRWVMLTPAILAAHVTAACILVSVSDPPIWRAGVGAAVFLVGIAFWFRARAQIGPLRVTRLPVDAPTTLRRDGAFAFVRNPLFFGYLLAAAGPALVAARPVLLLTFAACFLALTVRAEQEERRLRTQLGAAYVDYCGEVKRLIPFVW